MDPKPLCSGNEFNTVIEVTLTLPYPTLATITITTITPITTLTLAPRPALVVRREEVEDTRPSSLPLGKGTVNIFTKGLRVVMQKDISAYPPPPESFNKKPKEWKNAMTLAEVALKNSD